MEDPVGSQILGRAQQTLRNTDSSDCGLGTAVVSGEHSNEPSGSPIDGELFKHLCD